MNISLIVAMANNRVIGRENKIPWHLSADLKKFKQITMGSPIIMGRKTYASIGKALQGRTNIVISRNEDFKAKDCYVYSDISKALESFQECQEVFVIGGADFYKSMINKAKKIYLTEIHQPFLGDTYFPEINREDWIEVEREDVETDLQVDFTYSFVKLIRKNS